MKKGLAFFAPTRSARGREALSAYASPKTSIMTSPLAMSNLGKLE